MANLGTAHVNIRANLKPLRDGLKLARQVVVSAMKKIAHTVKRVAQVAVAGFIAISAASIKLAMDAQESENLFAESMGKMAAATRKWSDEMSSRLGLNAFEVRKLVSTFNVMLGSMGMGAEKSKDMSQGLVQLAYDMASFYNLKPAEAFQKLQAGITGEVEPLKRLGILINETAMKQYALKKGIGVTTKATKSNEGALKKLALRYEIQNKKYAEQVKRLKATTKTTNEYERKLDLLNKKHQLSIMTLYERKEALQAASEAEEKQTVSLSETEKVMVRYKMILQQTTKAQGDMERTLDSTTNVFRSLGSVVNEAGISFGEGLTPHVTEAAEKLRDWVTENKEQIKAWGIVVGEWLEKVLGYFQNLYNIVQDEGWKAGLKSMYEDIKEVLKITIDFIKPHAGDLGKAIANAFLEVVKAHPLIAGAVGAGVAGKIAGKAAEVGGWTAAGVVGSKLATGGKAAGGTKIPLRTFTKGGTVVSALGRKAIAAAALTSPATGTAALAAGGAAVTAYVGYQFAKEVKGLIGALVSLKNSHDNLARFMKENTVGAQ